MLRRARAWIGAWRRAAGGVGARLRARSRSIRSAAAAVRAELLTATAIGAGWALLTWGVAALLVPEVWLISAGLALLSLAGWRFLGELVWRGLYVLTKPGADHG